MLFATQLTHLAPVDLAILLLYFAMVIFIGFYVKGSTNTSEQFFLAGREMSAWIAGLSFVSANLGSLELMGWAGAAYQYGILATHWYWIGAIPAMLFLGIVMMPFYYISKTHSVPGYLQLRFGEGARGALRRLVRVHDRADVRRQHVLHGAGDEGRAGLEHQLLHVGGRGHGGDLRDAGRPAVGHHQRGAAVRADLGGRGADPDPRPDRGRRLDQPEGADHRAHGRSGLHAHVVDHRQLRFQPHGRATGPASSSGSGFVISFGYWTTDFLVVQRVLSANNLRAARLAPIIGSAFKMFVPFFVILPGLLALVLLKDSAGHLIQLYPDGIGHGRRTTARTASTKCCR